MTNIDHFFVWIRNTALNLENEELTNNFSPPSQDPFQSQCREQQEQQPDAAKQQRGAGAGRPFHLSLLLLLPPRGTIVPGQDHSQ
jgi:hypothetical protein